VRLGLPLVAFLLLAFPAIAQTLMKVPTGQALVPYEALWEDHLTEGVTGETWLILRFLAPEIARDGGRISYDMASEDLDFLCNTVGFPLSEMTGGGVDQIIVTLIDKPVPRGQRDPDATKFMNAYRLVKGHCEWN